MTIEVLKPGLLTSLQDAGRAGYAHLGVGRSGAFDNPALRIANLLCGNRPDACALELTLVGPRLRFAADGWVAVAGAPTPVAMDGREARMWAPLAVTAGSTLELGAMRSGCRAYLAVAGGIDAGPVLGSRSIDVNAALGPLDGRPLRAGDVLAVGPVAADAPLRGRTGAHTDWQLDPRPWFDEDPQQSLRLLPGRHLEQLTAKSRKSLFSDNFKVAPESNRVGVRLAGATLRWSSPIEMVSEGCVPGLLQLPPSGQPIAFGPECPVSGGYPRLGQLAAVDMPRLAQRRPGDTLRFRPCTLSAARDALGKRERALAKLQGIIAARWRSTP